MEDQNNAEATQEEPSNVRPVAKFTGSGGLSVAVWKQKTEQGFDSYSVRMDRSYKDGDSDNYKSTAYLRDQDLLRAGNLLQQADDWIEQDKGRQRTQASSQSR